MSDGPSPLAEKRDTDRYPHPQDFMHLVDMVLTKGYKSLALSGVNPGDGVSFVARELAFILAKNTAQLFSRSDFSDRVLLVEVDLKQQAKPRVPESKNEADGDLARSMLFTRDYRPGVDYIHTSPDGQGTLEFVNALWEHNEKTHLFDKWHTVLFDCPPVLQNRETLALTRRCSTAILVTSQGGAKREVIRADWLYRLV
jgi:Mrp family chromosome partitioning ATPase